MQCEQNQLFVLVRTKEGGGGGEGGERTYLFYYLFYYKIFHIEPISMIFGI